MTENAKKNILLIGCGQWSQSSHLPAICTCKDKISKVLLYDIDENQKTEALNFVIKNQGPSATILDSIDNINMDTIDGIIIATPPETHFGYLMRWAKNDIPILVDKPLLVTKSCAMSSDAAKQIILEYQQLIEALSHKFVMVGVQKRFQEVYRRIGELVGTNYATHGYPPTHIYVYTNDGYWILPEEFKTLVFHGYDPKRGGGKITHTGYHFLDIVPWIMRHASEAFSNVTHVWITATFFRPSDSVKFYNRSKIGKSTIDESNSPELRHQNEINANLSIRFCEENEQVISVIEFVFQHEGFSLRDISNRSSEAKTKGRIKIDLLQIDVGPFAQIRFERTAKILRENGSPVPGNNMGEKEHYQLVHISRDVQNPEGKITFIPLSESLVTACEQEPEAIQADTCDVDQEPTLKFLDILNGLPHQSCSSLIDHEIPMKLMYGAYLAASREVESEKSEPNWVKVQLSEKAMQYPNDRKFADIKKSPNST